MSSGWSVREEHDRAGTDRRNELLAAARGAFEDLGYGATTIAQITDRAGVSRATFYVYFASKNEVFAVLAREVRDRFEKAQDVSDLAAEDVPSVLRHTIATTLAVTAEHLALMTVLDHQALADPEIKRMWGGIRHESVLRTARYLERQAAAGRIQPAASAEALALMGAGMNDRCAPLVADGSMRAEDAVAEMHAIWMACLRR
ncbi:TetR/AcrR family transcriptional regulator [Aeromicrobium halocynthiae]|uniref:TetR/AcrR family transcriptional regulator n=1 Tax=Aeromicrobium halocynthiae TaxID=560557 RepID=A0ABN2VVV3_9ACTN